MMQAELIFVPTPGVGHLLSTVELAKLLASRDHRLSITIIIMKIPFDTSLTAYTRSLQKECNERIAFVELPDLDEPVVTMLESRSRFSFMPSFVECHKHYVKDVVDTIVNRSGRPLAGFVIDMFCTPMIDVANEYGVPSYAFYTSGAAFLGVAFYAQRLLDYENHDLSERKDEQVELSIPSFVNPVPTKVVPLVTSSKDALDLIASSARGLRKAKAILVNTFLELETHAIESLRNDAKVPSIYPVGPIINFKNEDKPNDAVTRWLDNQASSSVVFLCFGSKGSFEAEQVREIAYGLERSGQPFLWSLRQPPQQKLEGRELPKEYDDFEEVLPEGFLERTSGRGKVIGWAPQVTILSHPAVGGFVSHCGWNSTLESIWCGVPMATWPLYAEQQTNAFELVKELGMAVEIRMDYVNDMPGTKKPELVTADEIESGIRCLMNGDSKIRKKVKEMKEVSRRTTIEGGSSYDSVREFIEDVIQYQNGDMIELLCAEALS